MFARTALTSPFQPAKIIAAAMFLLIALLFGAPAASAQSVQSCTVPPGGPAPGANMCGDTHTWSSVQPGQTISGTMSWKGLAPAVILNGGSDVPGFNVDGGQVYGPVNYSWTIPAGTATGTYRATVHVEYGDFSCGLYGTCPLATPGYVIVQVSNTPPAPTVNDVTVSTGHNQAVSIGASTNGSVSSINIGTAANGNVSVSGFQMIYTPRAGFYGQDQFAYSANGPGGRSPDATVRVNVAPPPAPTAGNITQSFAYQTGKQFSVPASGVANTISVTSQPGNGRADWFYPTITYTPNNGFYGTDTLRYRVNGPGGSSPEYTVTLNVAPPPAPTAGNTNMTVAYQTNGAINVPISGVYTSTEAVTAPTRGDWQFNGTTFSYTPRAGVIGSDTFVYRASGPGGHSANATVNITISPPPAPTAGNTTMTASYNGGEVSRALPIGGVATEAQGVTPPSNGTYGFFGTTGYYTPRAGFYGTDSFTYRAVGPGGNSAPATVTVTVTPPAAPSVVNRSVSTAYNTSVSAATGVSGVYSSLGITAFPADGNASIVGTDIVYAPNAGFIGTNTIKFRAEGPGGFSNTGTITVTVNAPAAPTSSNATISTGYDTAVEYQPTLSGVVGGTNTIASPNNGGLAKIGNGWRYTPNAGYYGTDRWTFSVAGPGGTSPVYTVTVNVGVPPAPNAGNVTASTAYQTPVDVALTPTGVYSSVVMGSAPANGSASITGTTARYTPAAGFYGTDSFIYRAIGPGGNSATRTVTVTVAAPPAPSVSDVAASTAYNTPVVVQAAISGVGAVSNTGHGASGQTREGGTVSYAGNAMTFTPRAGFYGTDVFHYFATGPGGQSASFGVVTVTVAEPPAPAANNLSASTAYESPVAITLTASGVVASFDKVTDPANGSVSVAGATATYTPAPGFYGVNTFTYTATGPGGTSAPATVTVTVNVPPAPTAADTTLSTGFETAGTKVLPVAGVLTAVNIVTQPAKGAASITGTTLTYTPSAGAYGTDTLTYRATGPGGASQTRTVTITIATPAVPTVSGGSLNVPYEGENSLTLTVGGFAPVLSTATQPAHGAVTYSGNVAHYTAAPGYYGTDVFTVIASNAGGSSAPATVNVTVANPAPPTAQSGSGNLAYGETKTFPLAVAGVFTEVVIVNAPTQGVVNVDGDKAVYTPRAGYYGADSFRFRAVGPGGQSGLATFALIVGLPPAPAADDAELTTEYEKPGSLDLPTNGVTQRISVTQGKHGAVSVDGSRVTYTPALGFYGTDTFTYTASGPGGDSRTATVTVTVGLPPAPVADDASLTTTFETSKTAILPVSGVLTTVAIVGQPTHGVASITGTTLTYEPAAGYHGADELTYRATGPGGVSRTATVTITVGLPDAPSISDLNLSTDYNKDVTGTLFVTGFSPVLAVEQAPKNGVASVSGNQVTYTPTAGFFGRDTFTVAATNAGGAALPATVTVNVGLPPMPTVSGGVLTTGFETVGELDLNPAGVWTRLEVVTQPAHGTAAIVGQKLVFTPAGGFYGDDSLSVRAVGPGGTSGQAFIDLKVGLPGAPSVNAVTISTAFETAVSADLVIEGVASAASVVEQPAHGSAIMSGRKVTYTPAAGYWGVDTFTVDATGPGGTSAPATVTVNVALPGAPVAASSVSLTTAYETPGEVTLAASGVLTGFAIVSQPAHGAVSLNGDKVVYTPVAGYFGPDTFRFRAIGPGGNSAPATVAVTVGLPGAPRAVADRMVTPFETVGSLRLQGEGVFNAYRLETQPSHGAASLDNGVVTYEPASGYYGEDSFTFVVVGPGGDSAPATIAVTVGLPGKPVASPSSIETAYETAGSTTLRATGVFDGFTVRTQPVNGGVVVSGSTVTYTPKAGFFGSDSFTYVAEGPGGESNPATVAVTVVRPGAPVAAAGLVLTTPYETPVDAELTATGIYSTLALVSQPANGRAVLVGKKVTYTPAAGFFGEDAFTFAAQGPGGVSTPATVKVTVARPAAPVAATGLILTTPYETAVSGDLTANGVVSRLVLASQPTNGRAVLVGNKVTYTPAAGFFGKDEFTFVAEGPGGSSAPAAIVVNVGLPAAPVAATGLTLTTPFETAVSGGLSASGVVSRLALASQPANGAAVLTGDEVTYTPAAGFFGTDEFTFVAEGPGGTSTPAVVVVKVGLPAAPLAAEGIALTTPFETAVTADLNGTGVIDGYEIAATPAHGSVAVTGDKVTYTPATGFAGEDEFTFVARGPGGVSAPAKVTVKVIAAAPVASDVAVTTGMDEPITVLLGELSRFLTGAEIVGQPENGRVSLDGVEAIYTPSDRYVGADAFTFRVVGPGGKSEIAKVSITVEGGPAPDPNSLEKTGWVGEPIVFDVTAGLANGPFLSVRLVEGEGEGASPQETVGRVVVEGLKVVFYPASGWTGKTSFRFAVENRYGFSEPATVTAIVNPRPMTGPVIEVETWAGRPVEIDLMPDASGGPFVGANIIAVSPVEAADVVLLSDRAGDYRLKVTPKGTFNGRIEIRYTLANAVAVSDEGLVRVIVKERPDPSRDPEVSGLINAQTQAAYRFSGVQVANVMRRLEGIHGGQARRNNVGLSLVPMESLSDIPGDNPIMERQRDYMIAAGMVEHVGGSQGEARPGAAGVTKDGQVSWWLDGAADLGFKRRDAVREGFRFTTDGLTAGLDWAPSRDLIVGVGLGYGRDDSRVGLNGTQTKADAYSGFVYGSWAPRRSVFVDGLIGYTAMSYDAQRWASEAKALMASERDGRQLFGAVAAGWEHRGRRLHYSPYGRVEFADIELGSFTEDGDPFWSLAFEEQKSSRVTAALGVQGDYLFRYRSGDLLPNFRVEYRQEIKNGGETGVRYAEWEDSPRYSVELAPYDDKNLVLGLGLTWRGVNGFTWSVGYEGTVVNDAAQDGRLRLNIGAKF